MTSSLAPSQRRVLVADDETAIADTLQMILSQDGFEVAVAYDGKSAIEKARQFRPRIFLCDVMMPKMNGLEVAIQVHGIIPGCRILLLSGQPGGALDLVHEARLHGHEFELLLKPIHPLELLNLLHSSK